MAVDGTREDGDSVVPVTRGVGVRAFDVLVWLTNVDMKNWIVSTVVTNEEEILNWWDSALVVEGDIDATE